MGCGAETCHHPLLTAQRCAVQKAGWTVQHIATATEGQLQAIGINKLKTRVQLIVAARKQISGAP